MMDSGIAKLKAKLPKQAGVACEHGLGDVVVVDREDLLQAAKILKQSGFDLFLFVSGLDYPETVKLTYRLTSTRGEKSRSVFIKTEAPKSDPAVDSLTSLWPNADWHERETYDLFGVEFRGHPNMRRIFMPDDCVGYPLRKDYSDDHMLVFPEFAKDKEKKEKAAAKKENPPTKEKPETTGSEQA